jgi:hypothetical protein
MLHYLIGDATSPIKTPALLPHVVNDKGLWGSGYVISLSKKDNRPEHLYLNWHDQEKKDLPLGAVQICPYISGCTVANMVAQHDVRSINGVPPVRYSALKQALTSVFYHAKKNGLTVHMPRIAGVRSGGDWDKIEEIIEETMDGVETYVYTLPSETSMWTQTYENGQDYAKNSID